jgi:RsiW-degrading membrane proteinase PrsW (M82 family)
MTSPDPYATTPDYTASAGVIASAPAPAAASVAAGQVDFGARQQPRPARSNTMLALGIVGVCIAGLAGLLVLGYLLLAIGPVVLIAGAIMALVPLGIVVAGVLWVDRWEPEPRLALLFAFLWGAGVSVVGALIVGFAVEGLVEALAEGDASMSQFIGAAVQAPIVEEVGKGIGLLLIFLVARKHFDGPVDGIVYAAWVAAGFAFTENILYFGSQIIEAGSFVNTSVFMIFLVRGLMSPFAHVMFTAFTGAALGFAARRGLGPVGAIGFWIVGLIPAILLHAFWNGALFFVGDFFVYFFLVQFPLFLGVVAIVIVLRRQEAKLTRTRLAEYAAAGWLHPAEVDALATPVGRRAAKAWAARSGHGQIMKDYIRDATKLAFARQRVITGRDRIGSQVDEAQLLHRISQQRAALGAV